MSVWLLLIMLAADPGKPSIQESRDGALRLAPPARVFQDPAFQRRLFSGLTTSLEIITEIRTGKRNETYFCLIEIRYEVWEEQLLIRIFGADRRVTVANLGSTDSLAGYLAENPPLIASLEADHWGQGVSAKVQCRVIPFSKAEELETKAWFSSLLRVPEAGDRGQADRDRERDVGSGDSANSIFEVLMTTSIARQSVVAYKWRWRRGVGGWQ